MTFKKAQGNFRSRPDGWLHLWNFAATKPSGMAGALVNHILDDKQREIVEMVMVQRAMVIEQLLATSHEELEEIQRDPNHPKRQVRFEEKHNCWRFRKQFLIENFKIVVYSSMYSVGRNAAAAASHAINREYIQVMRNNKLIASRDDIQLRVALEQRLDNELNYKG